MNNNLPQQPRVYLRELREDYPSAVRAWLEHVGFLWDVAPGSRVFLKPNLTLPEYQPGVMTSYGCLRAVTGFLAESGYRVVIGEADSGGHNRFSMDEVFQKMGIYDLAREFGAEVVNISFTEPEIVPLQAGHRRLTIPLPKLLLHEVDAFITLPVPKIHMNTQVSMSLKNQWGCIQNPAERLKLHPYFAEAIYEVCRRLPRAYSIIDGRYGLNRTGPMRGDKGELTWVVAA